ncbi:hypothetical protein MML48_4g00018064 [Holotrichia oblita]|uniref:Uncharacterized protein n=1 Tax=Holotrichia oblita TaxID=644536 RepID=A0ACB9T8V9_HOLOL|nr:hypothetical protein MML48_4g00018064 [Holotrichia oblita]
MELSLIQIMAHYSKVKGEHHQEVWRDKKKVEAKFGIKNALLGFVFNKINSFIDQKTHWVDQLDRTNIAKNKAQGIYPPKDPVISLTGIITETVGQKLQAAGPLIGVVVQKLTSSSGGLLGGGSAPAPAPAAPVADHSSASAGFGIGNILGSLSAVKGFGSGGGHLTAGGYPKLLASSSSTYTTSTTKQPTTKDTVIYEKYESVTAAVPPELFNSGFMVISNISKRIGDFMLYYIRRVFNNMEYRNLTWTLLLLTVAHYQGSESSANAITKAADDTGFSLEGHQEV